MPVGTKLSTRDWLIETATRFGWQVIRDGSHTVFRKEPHSVMVEFRRGDDSVLRAQLFADAPMKTRLMPRVLEEAPTREKHKRVRYWLLVYH